MILLQTNKIQKSFGTDIILSNINIEVQSNERVALVGRNGCGKSTLLKMIAGVQSIDSGEIVFGKDRPVIRCVMSRDKIGNNIDYIGSYQHRILYVKRNQFVWDNMIIDHIGIIDHRRKPGIL